jgi:hypothetical protein
MSAIPPFSEVSDAVIHAVVPAFGTAALISGVIAYLAGRRGGYLAAAIGFAAGMLAGNYFRGCFVYQFQADSQTSLIDLLRGLWSVLTGMAATPNVEPDQFFSPPAGRYWIPFAALIATCSGVLTRRFSSTIAVQHLIRIFASAIVARLIVPAALFRDSPWVIILIGLTTLVIWTIAEWRPTRISSVVTSTAAGVASIGAAAVLLHAHSARLTDIATLVAFASFGITVAAFFLPVDVDGAVPALATLLPGMLVAGYHETFSSVPAMAFALPPLALVTPVILRFLPEWLTRGWRGRVTETVLIGLPVALAVILAARAEDLDFGH